MLENSVIARIERLHAAAMEALEAAERCLDVGDTAGHLSWLTRAYSSESQAAEAVESFTELEPTRSILFRSAATIALRRGDLPSAMQLSRRGLNGTPPQKLRVELEGLLAEVLALPSAPLPFPTATVVPQGLHSTSQFAADLVREFHRATRDPDGYPIALLACSLAPEIIAFASKHNLNERLGAEIEHALEGTTRLRYGVDVASKKNDVVWTLLTLQKGSRITGDVLKESVSRIARRIRSRLSSARLVSSKGDKSPSIDVCVGYETCFHGDLGSVDELVRHAEAAARWCSSHGEETAYYREITDWNATTVGIR